MSIFDGLPHTEPSRTFLSIPKPSSFSPNERSSMKMMNLRGLALSVLYSVGRQATSFLSTCTMRKFAYSLRSALTVDDFPVPLSP